MFNDELDMEVLSLIEAKNVANKKVDDNSLVNRLKKAVNALLVSKSTRELFNDALDRLIYLETRCVMLEHQLSDTERTYKNSIDAITKERDYYKKNAIGWRYQAAKLEKQLKGD